MAVLEMVIKSFRDLKKELNDVNVMPKVPIAVETGNAGGIVITESSANAHNKTPKLNLKRKNWEEYDQPPVAAYEQDAPIMPRDDINSHGRANAAKSPASTTQTEAFSSDHGERPSNCVNEGPRYKKIVIPKSKTTSIQASFAKVQVAQKRTSDAYGSIQPMDDTLVQCPICSRDVLAKTVNQHIESSCKSHLLPRGRRPTPTANKSTPKEVIRLSPDCN
jgi:hypothetical protein